MAELADIADAIKARMIALPALASLFNDANTYIVEDEGFLPQGHEVFAQIVIGQSTRPHADGGVALSRGSATIAIYRRLAQDHASTGERRIAGDAQSILRLAQTVEKRFANSYLGGRLVEGVAVRSQARLQAGAGEDAMYYTRAALTIEFSYDAEWIAPQTMNNGSTTDRGQAET